MKISRRDFHTIVLSASGAAQAASQDSPTLTQKLTLPAGPAVADGGEPFDFPLPPSPRLRWKVTGLRRQYFMEWFAGPFRTNPRNRRVEDRAIPVAVDLHRSHGRVHRGSRRRQGQIVPTL